MSVGEIPDRSIRICADRGGTFCDVHAYVLFFFFRLNVQVDQSSVFRSYPDPHNPEERKEVIVKLRECH